MESARVSTYLFAGDGLTEGVHGESYVERVAAALHGTGDSQQREVVNAGRGGDTASSLLRRIDRPLRRYRPDLVILAVGSRRLYAAATKRLAVQGG